MHPDSKSDGRRLDPPTVSPTSRSFTGKFIRCVILLILAKLAIWQLYETFSESRDSGLQPSGPSDEDASFRWEQITPTEELIYHPCFHEYECARLELPMDWNRTDGKGSKIALAVIKLPAKVPITDVRYGGPVLLNPGGPGGSGVGMALKGGKDIQTIVDSEETPSADSTTGKYFDVIGFDPRGINNTTPNFSCFRNPMARKAWLLQSAAEGILGSSEGAFNTLWARYEAFGMSCSQEDPETSDDHEWIAQHMNTAPVVADMVAFIERHGEWRERETEKLVTAMDRSGSKQDIEAIRTRNRWDRGQEKLQYWGFSYGTILGATFAAMQPHRIHRAVIDGVVDADDYYAADWLTNLVDADPAFDSFFEYCHTAGPASCPFALGDDVEDLKSRYEQLLSNITVNPIAVPPSSSRGPDIITYSDVKVLVLQTLYKPMTFFELLARLLNDLEHGNGSSFADYKYETRSWTVPSSSCDTNDPSPECRLPGDSDYETGMNILCLDGPSIDGITKEEFRSYWAELREQSKTIGDSWTQVRLNCIRLKTRPNWRFDGPFTGKTSHPLLLIGNTYDPVTPLHNAYKMSHGFSDSVVLHQNSVGHCSVSGPSVCTAKVVRQYFQTGELPKPGTTCEVDKRPFGLPGPGEPQVLSADDTALMSALRSLGETPNLLGA
ncbi:hypothetical protein BO70DRAFT_370735 [Aspergillus heteromorphus CBS 117.55]|uniref:Peptidase S33 tripeptidyl aminopeptidase-like C-terminal domain-containing protein n=1 Tax=Aspergillus heteromorphus CBS 117.55 TaxID=1448321 RepID=A0A317WAF6_9EURO|nr:uncharacterized protein BO70DRAFT_370735 [Aspergillus heteromorphus CBS 117.55]PWY83504.1 hypothetical protein BO70DRAFT_370735 [Aspergillus heteromorphus CBS 117.55]